RTCPSPGECLVALAARDWNRDRALSICHDAIRPVSVENDPPSYDCPIAVRSFSAQQEQPGFEQSGFSSENAGCGKLSAFKRNAVLPASAIEPIRTRALAAGPPDPDHAEIITGPVEGRPPQRSSVHFRSLFGLVRGLAGQRPRLRSRSIWTV